MYHFDCHKLYAHHEYLLLFRMETKESSKKLAILTLELKKHPSIRKASIYRVPLPIFSSQSLPKDPEEEGVMYQSFVANNALMSPGENCLS